MGYTLHAKTKFMLQWVEYDRDTDGFQMVRS